MNATTQVIIARLPKKPILAPVDIAAAYGLATCSSILADIKTGKIEVNSVGGKYLISHEAAEAYIAANEYKAQEGTLKK